MSKTKQSKNNPTNKKQSKSIVVSSFECEKCTDKCELGLRYLKLLHEGKSGKGITCIKLKEVNNT